MCYVLDVVVWWLMILTEVALKSVVYSFIIHTRRTTEHRGVQW
jgi:hypothetical protein